MTTLAQSNLAAGTYTPSQRYAGDAQIVSVNATLAAGQNLPDLSVLGRITATGLLTLCNTGAADGSQTPVAILVEATNAVANSAVAVYTAATAQGVECTQADVDALFAVADVTTQEPFTAMGRLGVQIVQPVEP
jgi:hypothetical protein